MERRHKRTDVSHKSCTAQQYEQGRRERERHDMTIKFAGDKWGTRNARSRNNFMVMPLCCPCNSELLCQNAKSFSTKLHGEVLY